MDMTEFDDVPGADAPLDASDAALLARVAELDDRLDPVPDGLAERALFAMTLAGLETEVMELQVVEAPVGSVRSEAPVETRTITFTHERLTVMIALSVGSAAGTVRVDGWMAPAEVLQVELRRPDGTRATLSDADGRFVLDDVPRGPASLLVHQGETPVTTPVIEL
ncbi:MULTISPECIES: hypothetical protein [Isoptericola]|uniref:Carboxypeptidase family protein n=1 Tax=Isoptericola sediminis TaxID=2733572 RepID=A0A849K2E5_9MICO|nr:MULTISPECIES: hypothetical protein [Isoptericola]MDO8143197.1 hypothetical protein [Isoptericola sp. 178]MDO8147058.1 hypothetical protein [Isoptericola sp. b515]MDO8150627.1 hypothetical protein [Isoptericola sp. b408]NNU26921.1 hypothetical protein [Isoptericola sediminis]